MKRFSYGLVSFFLFFVAESVSSADTIDYVYTENGLFGTMDLQNGSFTTIGSLSTTYDDMTRFPKPASLTLLGSALLGLGVVYLRRRGGKTMVRPLFATALLASAVSARADVFKMGGSQNANGTWTGLASLSFVTVGDPGNAADTTGYGSVPYVYQMGRYDVTLGQYTAFLNSVATKSDPYGLYYSGMAPGNDMPTIGIVQSGAPGSYSYTVGGSYSQAANCPIYDVSWGDAARFVNWLDNGQPTSGTESTGTTETGAYALNGATSQPALMAVPSPAHSGSNAAAYFLPSENEWYKAAYYSGGGTNSAYYAYPTKSNTAPGNTLPDLGNNANFYLSNFTDPTNYLTPVGSFADSPGPYGTYDMGGDVFQWNEADISGSFRGLRGGTWDDTSLYLASSYRSHSNPTTEYYFIGFRVASSVAVPEPGSLALLLVCAVAFGIWRQRRNA